MILDSEEQRQMLLNIISSVQVRGDDALDALYALKMIIKQAKLDAPCLKAVKEK